MEREAAIARTHRAGNSRKVRIASAATAAAVLAAAVAATPPAASAEPGFREIETALFVGHPPPALSKVRRWSGTVFWSAGGERKPAPVADILAAAAEINLLLAGTGVFLSPAFGEFKPRIVISYLPPEKVRNLAATAAGPEEGRVGQTIAFPDGGSGYGFVAIAVADDLPLRHRRYVIRHELLHAMGIPKHVGQDAESVMCRIHSPDDAPSRLLDFDRMLLRFLYRDVRPGATPEEVRRVWESRPR